MVDLYTIGQLAKTVGVPTSTLRFYERIGLLKPSSRSGANYRLYADRDLERVRFIRAAQATGFTLDDVAALLDHLDRSAEPCREVQVLIDHRLAEIRQRVADLRHVEHVLHSMRDNCRRTEVAGRCEVLDQLRGTSAPDRETERP